MISQRLDADTMGLIADMQQDLYKAFAKKPLFRDTIYEIAAWIENYFRYLRTIGCWVPHFTLYVGVNPFSPSVVEIYDEQNFDYIFPKERVPKWAVKVSL